MTTPKLYPFKKVRTSFFIFIFVYSVNPLFAQDMEGFWGDINQRIQQKDILRANGSLNVNLLFNNITGILPRQQAFSWQLTAGINFDILGIQTPFSAAFSNGNDVYRLPNYSFYGISPTYKWITLHAGDRSINLSPYTMNGISFRGAGVELSPGKFDIAFLHGRLRRARARDVGAIQNIESRYRRLGTGVRLGYNGEKTKVSSSLFLGRDVDGSLDPNSVDSLDFPEENLALSLTLEQEISSALRFKGTIAKTALTRDQNSDELNAPRFGQRMFGLYRPRVSTGFHTAYEFDINFQPGKPLFGIQYRRVNPGYRTLGTIYFQNDLENITGRVAFPLAKGKIRVAGNAGIQRNDLNNLGNTNFTRFIGSFTLSGNLTERTTANLTYSNFNTTNRLRAINAIFPQVDSLVIVQTNQSLALGGSYLLGPDKQHIFVSNLSFQRANAIRNEEVDTTQDTRFIMAMVNYAYRPKESNRSFSVGIIFHRNELSVGNLTTIGPSISYGQSFFDEKVQISSTVAYSRVSSSSLSTSSLLRLQTNVGMKIGEAQNIGLTASYVVNNGEVNEFQELQANVTYGYVFQSKK